MFRSTVYSLCISPSIVPAKMECSAVSAYLVIKTVGATRLVIFVKDSVHIAWHSVTLYNRTAFL